MINRFAEWVKDFSNDGAPVPCEDEEFATMITALLVEAGMADGTLDGDERAGILHLLTDQLELADDKAETILEDAISAHDSRVEIHSIVRQIRAETELQDRIIILEMIWMVVLADQQLDSHESQLMRRLAGLLYIDDVASGLAAKRAQKRLGLAD